MLAALLAAPFPAPAADRLAGPYDAQVLRVIDGDTFEARVPVWLGLDMTVRIRLRGVDTPELHGPCPAQAQAAKAMLSHLLATGPVRLTDITHDKYAGRVDATVVLSDGRDVGKVMEGAGMTMPCR
ncbi:MAG TPA: thermonuclease family protein [Candidatus Omnitrophota bacterium]|nr:thermonuclease family protein [Candidatus Omnitrophota bacterium]